MLRHGLVLALSLGLAPLVAFFSGRYINAEAVQAIGTDIRFCDSVFRSFALDHACDVVSRSGLLQSAALAVLVAAAILVAAYVAVALLLARKREWLARYFPIVIRAALGMLIVFLVLQAALVLASVFVFADAGRSYAFLLWLALLGAGLLFTAVLIVSALKDLGQRTAIDVSGGIAGATMFAGLVERIQAIADQLGAKPPRHVLVGLQPLAFVTNQHVRLPSGEVLQGETLYLSATYLRSLRPAELDFVIAHELAHFRAGDLVYSERFVPAFRQLEASLERLGAIETANAILLLARLPAQSLLAGMHLLFLRNVTAHGRRRELEADRAAIAVCDKRAAVSALARLIILDCHWQSFRLALSSLIQTGTARRNLVADYIVRTRRLVELMTRDELGALLLGGRVAHPLDTHPTFSERASALDADPGASLYSHGNEWQQVGVMTDAQISCEEQISAMEFAYLRPPGARLSIDEGSALPAAFELARVVAEGEQVT